MTSVRETRPRAKPARRSRRRAEDAGLLDPLAPPDVFAPLATDRLILRPLVPEDADALHRLVNDWEVARNLAVVPFPYPRELADDWIQSTRRSLADGSAYQLAITGREGEHEILVGVVGLRVDAGQRVRAARLLGRAGASGAMASPPRPPAGWRAGRWPTSTSTGWRPA